MTWIKTISDQEATGPLRTLYQAAIKRAGRVYGIVRSMSLNPSVLRASMAVYREAVHGESPLPRAQRELLATVVSRTNDCHY